MRDLDALQEQLLDHLVNFHGRCSCGERIPDHKDLRNVAYHLARELVIAGFGQVDPCYHAYSVVPGMAMCGKHLDPLIIPPRHTGYTPTRRAMLANEVVNVTCEACRERLY